MTMICISPISIKDPSSKGTARISVPCGKCGACLHNRRVDWSFRLKEENRAATSSWFITLTYDDYNIPRRNGIQTISKRELQLLMMRIRKENTKLQKKIAKNASEIPKMRYYAVGEYGSKTDRPHYHMLLFNVHHDIISKFEKFWKKGQFRTDPVGDGSIHYITKYHVNSRRGKEYLDEDTGELLPEKLLRQSEFALMSKGIGKSYIDRIGKWHTENGNRNYVINNGFKQRVPRYYRGKCLPEKMTPYEKMEIITASDERYKNELERLEFLKIQNPSVYYDLARYQESLRIMYNAKNQDKL